MVYMSKKNRESKSGLPVSYDKTFYATNQADYRLPFYELFYHLLQFLQILIMSIEASQWFKKIADFVHFQDSIHVLLVRIDSLMNINRLNFLRYPFSLSASPRIQGLEYPGSCLGYWLQLFQTGQKEYLQALSPDL